MNSVWKGGFDCEELAPVAGFAPDRLAGLTKGNRKTVFGAVSKPMTLVPSGVMDVGNCGFALVVSRSTVPAMCCSVRLQADRRQVRRKAGH